MGKAIKSMSIWAAAAVAAFGAFLAPASTIATAEEDTPGVSGVMADLQQDATFNAEDYPEKTLEELRAAQEEYLQLIKIGESVNGGLYLYVYQPSDSTTEMTATMVNMSLTTGEIGARIYPLQLVSTEGVFDKYLVEGLQVLDFEVRNYNITSLYRPWMKGVDSGTGNDNTDSSMAIPVGQTWYARNTDDGAIEYAYTYDDVVTITSEWHGEIDYEDGMTGVLEYANTTSHFIAFTTDYKIEELLSAEITYNLRWVDSEFCMGCLTYKTNEVKDYGRQYVKIYASDMDTNNPHGWVQSPKYVWKQINTIDGFLSAEEDNLSTSAKNELGRIKEEAGDNGAFVLRFLSTEYISSTSFHLEWWDSVLNHMVLRSKSYEVSDVMIIRLTFKMQGVPYTLGVVDTATSSDGVVDGGNTGATGTDTAETLIGKVTQLIRAVGLIIGAVALGFIIYFLVLAISKLVAFIKSHPINFGGGGSGGGSGGGNNKDGGNAG